MPALVPLECGSPAAAFLDAPFLSNLSSRPEWPGFFLRADVWRARPRSGGITARPFRLRPSNCGTQIHSCASGFPALLHPYTCAPLHPLLARPLATSMETLLSKPISIPFRPR